MDGMQLVMKQLLPALGVKPEDIENAKTALKSLVDSAQAMKAQGEANAATLELLHQRFEIMAEGMGGMAEALGKLEAAVTSAPAVDATTARDAIDEVKGGKKAK